MVRLAERDALARRRHIVRCRPSPDELARRAPFVVTGRDKGILHAVHQHRFLTTELVELAFFPPPATGLRVAECSRAYERLRLLWLWGYLERIELPVARQIGGRRPYLYALGRRAVPLVEALRPPDAPAVGVTRIDRTVDDRVDHDLLVAGVWANLVAALRGGRATSFRWFAERDLRARRWWVEDPKTGHRLPVLPDGCAVVGLPDGGVHACLFEVDMGSLTLARFARKVRALEAWLASGAAERALGCGSFEVAVLTHSQRRLESLCQGATDEVPSERWGAYLFATFDALAAEDFGGYPWTTLEGEEAPLLPDEVWPKDLGAGRAT
jgi:hypothetical protein